MTNRTCPTLHCTEPVPAGPHAVFCAECHFRLPYRTTSEIFALQIACARTDDADQKAYLREQIDAHVRIAARSLEAPDAA
ncbi:hypothetical protein [Mesorhizobium sp. 1M-11]|uniref:hypothetical protein n=1 Tax=Mesorhizobium sp. 1M-11 TaxID=1529006 RepID=UPI0006C73C79|nr:hypothetical protein [Mesorhizobium sp. 1M-11]